MAMYSAEKTFSGKQIYASDFRGVWLVSLIVASVVVVAKKRRLESSRAVKNNNMMINIFNRNKRVTYA